MQTTAAKSIIQANHNFNLTRGCTHGCIYCDTRSVCYQVGPLEVITLKEHALQTMAKELGRKRRKVVLTTGAMSDPYLPHEAVLSLMRGALKLIADHYFGIAVLTKSDRILLDIDLYALIHSRAKAIVQLTITTTDDDLAAKIEPHVSRPSKRLEALGKFAQRGIPTGIWLTPVLPWLTDTEENIQAIVTAAAAHGVTFIRNFGMGTTMRTGSREYFYERLDALFPGLKARYMQTFGNCYVCPSPNHAHLEQVFQTACEQYGILYKEADIQALFRLDTFEQGTLF